MKRKNIQKAISVAFAAALALALPASAFAASAISPAVSETISGITYTAQVNCWSSSGTGTASATIQSSAPVGTKYMGANVVLGSSGSTVVSRTQGYNTSPTSFYSVATSGNGYSQYRGYVDGIAWNASGHYQGFGPTSTILISAYSTLDHNGWKVNSAGLTYGTLNYLADDGHGLPDLIEVLGINGNVGYVYKSAWNSVEASTPEEALELIEQGSVTLPVYDCEGQTVIDSFIVNYAGDQ